MTRHNTAFRDFYLRYAHLVRRVVAWKCPPEEIDDVVMQVWKRIQTKWPFAEVENIEAYLTRCAQNEVKMFLRDRSCQKRPPPKGRMSFPEDPPSGVDPHESLRTPSEVSGNVDRERLRQNFLKIGEELSGDKSELMKRFLDDEKSVSPAETRKLVASAKKHIKRLGAGIDRLKEGPSFLGHIARKLDDDAE
jgi:DNA-directed RNA polymerase specialized sigma24 family protein